MWFLCYHVEGNLMNNTGIFQQGQLSKQSFSSLYLWLNIQGLMHFL